MINWNKILNSTNNVKVIKKFANGNVSGRTLYNNFSGTDIGGEVRNALRTKGVLRLRRASREALRRRGQLL